MITRRDALRLGLLGGSALLLGRQALGQMGGGGCGCGGGGGMGGGGMGGGGIIDPPLGAPFHDVPDVSQAIGVDPVTGRRTVDVWLTVQRAPVNVNGVTANLYTYNGLYPGPAIRVRPNDWLRIHFTNGLPYTTSTNVLGFTNNVTNLHVHGMHVSPMMPADAAHIAVLPGGSPLPADPAVPTFVGRFDYEYDLSMQAPGCLHFYHSHSHGRVAEQHWGGLAGPIIVEDPTTLLSGLETHVLVLKDIALSGSEPAPHTSAMDYMQGKEGSTVVVNGQVNPVLPAKPGQVQRWRVVNASNARFYKLSLEGHSLYVIGTDGGLLDRPYAQSSIILSPGERVDVLVKASTTKANYRLLSLPYSRMGMTASAQITLMTMQVSGTAVKASLPSSVDPGARRLTVDTSMLPQRTYTLGMSMGRGYINGHDFDVAPDETHSMLGGYEVWQIVNQTNMDHPWHQHVNAAQVLSITGGDSAYRSLYTGAPCLKDVTIVPKGGSIRLLVPVMDWPGMTMYHCHILEHEDIGMMGMWHIMGGM